MHSKVCTSASTFFNQLLKLFTLLYFECILIEFDLLVDVLYD